MELLLKEFTFILAIFTALWAIYVFNKQQKFKRLQNLSQMFQRFGDTQEFMDLFSLFDQAIDFDNAGRNLRYNTEFLNKLESENTGIKLRYLVLLEEVSLYVKAFELDRGYAVHLFQ